MSRSVLPRSVLRRALAAAVLGSTAFLGLLTTAGTAQAQPNDVRDRVFNTQLGGSSSVLVPDRSASGAAVRLVPRIGKANETPVEQTWRSESSRAGRGAFTLVHTPSLAAGQRKLCLDVQGDSTQAGAPLVLRPCDGTESQAWRQLNTAQFTQFENQGSKLKIELVGNRLVQAEFPARGDADFRERGLNQLFAVRPKSFGIGGA